MTNKPSHNADDLRAFLPVLHWALSPDDLIGFGTPRSVRACALSIRLEKPLRGFRSRYVTNSGICRNLGRRSHASSNAGLVSCLALDVDDPVAHAAPGVAADEEAVGELLGAVSRRVAEETAATPALEAFTGGGGLLLFRFSRAATPPEYSAIIAHLPFLAEISDGHVLRAGNLIRAVGTWHAERGVRSRVLGVHEGVPLDVDDLIGDLDLPTWSPPPPRPRTRWPFGPRGDVARGRRIIRDLLDEGGR
jgi:hypothetical protein